VSHRLTLRLVHNHRRNRDAVPGLTPLPMTRIVLGSGAPRGAYRLIL
jgi:hypothetical protein